jgi:hypothetical protein
MATFLGQNKETMMETHELAGKKAPLTLLENNPLNYSNEHSEYIFCHSSKCRIHKLVLTSSLKRCQFGISFQRYHKIDLRFVSDDIDVESMYVADIHPINLKIKRNHVFIQIFEIQNSSLFVFV